MKRTQMYKKVNHTKSNIFNHFNRNVVYPTIVFNPDLSTNELNTAIEIVELSSDTENHEKVQSDQYNHNHTWYNITDTPEQDDINNYIVNKRARDNRRRTKIKRESYKENDSEDILNQIFTEFYGIDCHNREDKSPINTYQSEYFTIINNHNGSDTSSDSNRYEDIEIIQSNKSMSDDRYWNVNNNTYAERLDTYDESNAEKRTIWIYALKNKRYLSDHDFELTNIPSKESLSTTDEEELTKNVPNISRVATPIPNYIPKLNLPMSPTLPTVTEVAEPNKQSSSSIVNNNSNKIVDNEHFQKHLNSSVGDKTYIKLKNNNYISSSNESYIDDNCHKRQVLSPRSKRRIKISKECPPRNSNVESEVTEKSYCEPKIIIHIDEPHSASHVEVIEKDINNIERWQNKQVVNNEISTETIRYPSNESITKLQKPRIKLKTETIIDSRNVSDPIEKLEGNWIGNAEPELIEVYDYNINTTDGDDAQNFLNKTVIRDEGCADNRLFIRNMSVIKPAEWTQYMPVTGSVSSLHLSLSIDTDVSKNRKSWFKRFLKFVHCCK